MIEIILNWLKDIGLIGLFIAMFIEGSSLPFPGIVVVLAYGYILPIEHFNVLWIAAAMSFIYCIASLIPYYLGSKIEGLFRMHSLKGIQKAKYLFDNYGVWSISISRPFGLGNYISYIAGMSKMRPIPYLFFTFIGIYPWSYVMILLGKQLKGNYEAFNYFYQDNSVYLFLGVALLLGIMFLYSVKRNKTNKVRTNERGEG